ncbi:MAG TPA: ABC transporter ATP-binding protein [Thermoplasmata archaeon]|nr:ABC transporter ATP-binding protein [Thermoplasmata archaeon]
MTQNLLQVEGLKVHFPVKMNVIQAAGRAVLRRIAAGDLRESAEYERPRVHAVDGISFDVSPGEILGLVGESGCGKTTTGRAVVRLVEPTDGRIVFEGRDITHVAEEALRPLRPRMQIVFQDPHAALNPAMTIGQSIMDPLLIHASIDSAEAKPDVLRVMTEVGLSPAADLFTKYPADLSGGQKQRAVIARAIVLRPSLLVADEPVAMLDMSIRARILELLLDLRRRYQLALLFITHDLATAKFLCDRIAIMYLGRIVELGAATDIFRDPKHPYTRALIAAVPVPEPGRARPESLPHGEIPDAIRPPAGCRFHPRCPVALPSCGWEGRDFIDFLEERHLDHERAKADEAVVGTADEWHALGLTAGHTTRDRDPSQVAAYVRSIMAGAPEPLAKAVEAVDAEADQVVVRFRAPDPLAPKQVEGRMVECLLY